MVIKCKGCPISANGLCKCEYCIHPNPDEGKGDGNKAKIDNVKRGNTFIKKGISGRIINLMRGINHWSDEDLLYVYEWVRKEMYRRKVKKCPPLKK